MKKLTKILAVILVLALLSPSVAAAAVDTVQPLSSAYLASYSVYLIISGTTVRSHFRVTGMSVLEEIGAKEIILQESPDGVTWTDVATFSYTDPAYASLMIASGKQVFNSNVPYEDGIEGYYYRAYVTIWGGDGTNGDARYAYTTVKQI